MAYEAKNFDGLLGMEGFSDALLKNHFTLYQGYVTNTNKLSDSLLAMAKEGKAGTPEYAEMKRRFGWEFNGMRLHELYFGNMKKGGSATLTVSALDKKGTPVAVPTTWKSSNPKIAKVEAGVVTAVRKGKAKITVSAGRKAASAKVTVTK